MMYLFAVITSDGRGRSHHPPPVTAALQVVAVWVTLQVQLHGRHGVHLLLRLRLLLLGQLLHGQPAVLAQLDPLLCVADAGVLDEGAKDHEEADAQVDVDGLHVGDLGEGGVHAGHQGGHGEHSGDPEADAGRSGAPVEPEGDPGHDYDEA